LLTNTILILNGKGGVGKTSLTANLAGLAARSGWPTLAVDLDRQGNLQRDLGYASDGGRSLVAAAFGRGSVEVIREVRPGLDVIAGGRVLDELVAQMQVGLMNSKVSVLKAIEKALEPLASNYDVVLLDSGPGEPTIQAGAVRASHFVLIPTRTDDASLDGLDPVAQIVTEQLESNPAVRILGVAVMFVPANGTAILETARSKIKELIGPELLFDNFVRSAPAIGDACRAKGQLAYEYEEDAAGAEKWWKARREGRKTKGFSAAASNLAGDYEALGQEVFARYLDLLKNEPVGGPV